MIDDQAEPLQRLAKSLESLEKLYAEQLRQSELRMAEFDKQRTKFEESRVDTVKLLNRVNILNLRKVWVLAFLALIVAVVSLVATFTH
jgi:hypothetical protein